MANPVLIFGATDRGKVAASILAQNDVMVYGFLDDDAKLQGKAFGDASVLGGTNDAQFLDLLSQDCTAFIALEDAQAYQALHQRLATNHSNIVLINVIHPSVWIGDIRLGEGNCLQAGIDVAPDVVISAHCTVGSHAILQSGAILHDFVQVGAAAILGKHVLVEKQVIIGEGAIIKANVTIGEGSYIPAGAIVHEDVPAFTTLAEVNNTHTS